MLEKKVIMKVHNKKNYTYAVKNLSDVRLDYLYRGLGNPLWKILLDLDHLTFKTKVIRKETEHLLLSSSLSYFNRLKWVPSKMNIFVWRALSGWIPSNSALLERNIIKEAVCKHCNYQEENSDHIHLQSSGYLPISNNNQKDYPHDLLHKVFWSWECWEFNVAQ